MYECTPTHNLQTNTHLHTLSILFPTSILIMSCFVAKVSSSLSQASSLVNDCLLLTSYTGQDKKSEQMFNSQTLKTEKNTARPSSWFQFQILQNCGPYIWWANKVKGGLPLTPTAKESISPCAQIINRIKNSYLRISLFLDQQIPLFYSQQNMWHQKLEYDWTPHTALLPLEEKKTAKTFDTFLNRPFKT